MVEKRNKETGLLEVHVPAVVKEIKDEVYNLNNEKLTPYKLGTSQIKYPDGGTEDVLTRFYTKSIAAHPDTFKAGSSINLVIQTEGDYAGRAVAQLPGTTVDISRLLGRKETDGIALTTARAESVVKENVIDEELVA
jgi:hypothetical protein